MIKPYQGRAGSSWREVTRSLSLGAVHRVRTGEGAPLEAMGSFSREKDKGLGIWILRYRSHQ